MYKVSVIMPVYNNENDIKDSVDSIINQSFGFNNIELIIVDDKSTDNSRNIIKNYMEEYDNIKGFFLKKNNGGPGKPRNVGIENSNSKYIMFIDCGDKYSEGVCEVLYDKITTLNLDLVKCNLYVHHDGIITKSNVFDKVNRVFNHREVIEIFQDGYVSNGIFCAEIIKKNNIKFSENINYEDTLFVYEYYFNSFKMLYLHNFFGYHYIIPPLSEDNKSMSRGSNLKKVCKTLNGLYEIYKYLDSKNNDSIVKYFFNNKIPSIFPLIFKLSKKEDKLIILNELYKFELLVLDKYDFNVKFNNRFENIYNKFLLSKHFLINIFIGDILIGLYKLDIIRKVYRKHQN